MSSVSGKVYVAMSGGVDSSVVAALLLQQGYDCHGVFMITHDGGVAEVEEVRKTADRIGIELDVIDLRSQFQDVIDYFINEYQKGRTPNPCVYCNRTIKFGKLWDYAKSQGADFIATGHYMQRTIKDGHSKIYMASNLAKDQSYVLSLVGREVIDHILFPIGQISKDDTRNLAAELELGVENKPDSQDICFIPDNDYIARLEQECPQISRKGNIVHTDGRILGTHNGIHRYTIGQRRGLGVALGEPAYVVSLDAVTNTVFLGSKEDVMSSSMHVGEVNWLIDKPDKPFRSLVKIRYNHRGNWATVKPCGKTAIIEFEQDVSAVTPGQTAVFYLEDEDGLYLVGGAWINGVGDE